MKPDSDDAVVRLHAFQRRFLQQDKVGNFARLNSPDLRIELELPCVADCGGFENLFKGYPRLFKLLHLQKAV